MEYDRFQEILQEEAEKIPEKFYEGRNHLRRDKAKPLCAEQ